MIILDTLMRINSLRLEIQKLEEQLTKTEA